MTREQHLQWAKKRALEYLDTNDVRGAVMSILSDLRKHPETDYPAFLGVIGIGYAGANDADGARKFIEGF